MTGPTNAAVDRIVARIKRLEDSQHKAHRTPQLTRSSIDGGAVNVRDGSGQLTAVIGQQYDGTYGAVVVAGPIPPVPVAPELDTVNSGVRATWRGEFVQTTADRVAGRPTVAPQDFAKVEIQVSETVDFSAGASTRGGLFINSAAGGYAFAPWTAGQALYARARTWSLAGKASAWSLTAGPVEAGKIGIGDVGFDLSQLGGSQIYYGTVDPRDTPGTTLAYGDLWLKEVGAGPPPQYELYRWTVVAGADNWAKLADQGVVDAAQKAIAAQQAADSKARLFTQATAPAWSGAAGTAIWVDTANGNVTKTWDGSGWVARRLGNGAIQPQSLIASDVLATGTVSAALLEALLVLSTAVIAGNPNGTHALLDPNGLRIFREDAEGGDPDEVIRLGTLTNDYFGIVDSSGELVASVDETGQGNFSGLHVGGESYFQGRSLTQLLEDNGAGQVGYFEGNAPAITGGFYGPIRDRVGIAEVNAYLRAGRRYKIVWKTMYMIDDAGSECRFYIQYTAPTAPLSDTADAPLVTSQALDVFLHHPAYSSTFTSANGHTTIVPTTTGRHRFLLTVERGGGTGNHDVYIISNERTILHIDDMGPTRPATGQLSQGGGTIYQGAPPPPPPPPTQQYFVEIGTDNRGTFRGNGTQRFDTNDVVQGWDPSGFNGDGYGWFGFGNQPFITGNVDRVDLYLYWNHWYYNAGGTAIINIISAGTPNVLNKLRSNWHVPGWPKPGGVWVTLPSDWWAFFRASSSPRAYGISLGPSGGTNLSYYGRASDCRLRIWYTQ